MAMLLKKFKKILCFVLFLSVFTGCNKGDNSKPVLFSIKDDMERELSFEKFPNRIISLAPNITEILFSIGAVDKVVGVTNYCNFPPEAAAINKVADLVSVNYEALAAANPDLVLLTVEGNSKESFDKIISMGINIFVSNPRNLNGILNSIKDFGTLTNNSQKADSVSNRISAKLDSLRESITHQNSPKILFLVSIAPIISIGENTYLNEVIKLSGGKNICAESKINYPVLNREEVLAKKPDYILLPDDLNTNSAEVLKVYPEWKVLPAAKNNRIKLFNADLIQRPGTRVAEAVEEIINITKNK
jgi:iron complex transport system substrate-binding protein